MSLKTGQILSHYRIAEKIGEGGMGAVYRAEDTKLDRTVALKVLPEEMAADPDRLERFQREAKTVAALNHPHIVTLHSVEEDGGTHFLTMELVEGQSLDRSLPAGGLPLARVFDVGIALADALAAAHDRGIVHRDLKPANVMLTADGRVKVLDFGLAKLVDQRPPGAPPAAAAEENTLAATRAATLTDAGTVMGTVPYMSPEQLRGESVDHRSDIFSLGSVLHEMSTGHRAFQGESSADLISSIVRDTPSPVTELRDDLPRHLARIIAHCLQKDPEARYQSAKDVRNELRELRKEVDSGTSVMTSAHRMATGAAPAGPGRGKLVAAGMLGLVAVVAVTVMMIGGTGTPEPVAPEAAPAVDAIDPADVRRSVAVLGFKNLAGRDDVGWLSTALAEMLTTELAGGGELRTVPGESIAETKRNLALAEGDTYSPETLGKIRALTGGDFVVLGSFLALGESPGRQIRLDLRLQDTAAGETVDSLSVTGTESDLLSLVAAAGDQLRQALGAAAATAAQREALRATVPSDPEAARAYHEGLEAQRRAEYLAARELFEKAAAIEPDHPMIRWALAGAWDALGYDRNALAEAERAFQHSGSLPEAQRWTVEGRYRVEQNEWKRAAEVYRAAWEAAPDDLDAGLRLADALGGSAQNEEQLEVVARLRTLPDPLGQDPRIDLQESYASGGLLDPRRAESAARRALDRARELDAPLLEAVALDRLAWVLPGLGRRDEAQTAAQTALEIRRAKGSPNDQANALITLAEVELDPHKTLPLYEEAREIWRERGNRYGELVILNNMSNSYEALGDLDRARDMTEASLEIMEEIDPRSANHVVVLSNLAFNRVLRGDLEGTDRLLTEAVALAQEIGAVGVQIEVSIFQAVMHMVRAQLADARSGLDETYRSCEEAGLAPCVATIDRWLALVDHAEDRSGSARERLARSIARFDEMGVPEIGARRDLARIELDAGRPERAEPLIRRAIEADTGGAQDLLESRAVLARTLAELERVEEADLLMRAVLEEIRDSQHALARLSVWLDASKLEIYLGRTAEARRRLEAIRDEAQEMGWVERATETRLLLARLELGSGDAASGLAALRAVEDDARALGLERCARLAAETAGP